MYLGVLKCRGAFTSLVCVVSGNDGRGCFFLRFWGHSRPRCSAQAISILELSLKNACLRRDICEEDLDMVRDQIITVEVNIARVFNHDVVRRRQAKGEVEA